MNVLLIPEDFRHDQYILKPIFEALLGDLGRPSARVRVCIDPLLGGVRHGAEIRTLIGNRRSISRKGGRFCSLR